MKRRQEQLKSESPERKRLKTTPTSVARPSRSKKPSTNLATNLKLKHQAFTPFTLSQHNMLQSITTSNLPDCFENVIVVEGNIGSGKSTLLKRFEDKGYTVLQEPVDTLWTKYLPLMYGDVKRWGMTFQFEVLFWYLNLREKILPELLRDDPDKIIVLERSSHSAYYIFIKNLHRSGLMTEWEYDLLERFFKLTRWNAGTTFYLQVDPDICAERVKIRNRKGEDEIDRTLLKNLHDLHEDLYSKKMYDIGPVICLDAKQDIEKVCADALSYLHSEEKKDFDNIIG